MKKKFVSVLSFVAAASMAQAADIHWTGGTADYTNTADWAGGVVPGGSDNAINDNGTNNAVQISVGNPDWLVDQIRAGNGAGDGAFIQNGQAVTLIGTNTGTGFITPFRLGVAAGNTGVYTLNGGSINYSNGGFNIGELGTGILNISGGTLTGSGNFADNLGTLATPLAVNATVGGGTAESDFTWFEQGLSAANPSIGLPAAGSTIVSLSQADHSYTLPPSYTANNAMLVSTTAPNATITMSTPTPVTGLSFMGTAGVGPVGINYVVHHADSTTETGSLSMPDWFGPAGTANEVMAVGGRVDALGINFQFPGSANGGTGSAPYLWSLDIPITHTASAVTSVDLTYTSGGTATLLSVSSQSGSGGPYVPVTITGFNKDVVVEVGSTSVVSPSVTDIVNQTNGAINVTGGGQLFVGNVGTAVYNLIGGSVDVHNYIAIGRSSGNGTLNMTGGTFNQDGGGNLLVGTGFNNNGNPAVGVLNQSGGTINSLGQFLCPENSPSTGTYNMSGTAILNVNNWIAIGRQGGTGILNLTNGVITKTGGGGDHITIGSGGTGTLNQYGGTITNTTSDFFLGESSAGTWNMNGGTAVLGNVLMAVNNSASAQLNLSGGVLQASEVISPTSGSTVSLLNFNGGTLQANANSSTFISGLFSATIGVNGAVIDSQGFNITVPQELDDNGGGTLTKLGTGTLTLTGPNTYAGPTVVSAGTLTTGTGSTASGGYTVADNAGFGVLVQSANSVINVASVTLGSSTGASLNFNLGSFGNPAVAPLNVNGALTVNGTVTVNIADSLPQIGQFPLVHFSALAGAGNFMLGTLPVGIVANLVTNVPNSTIDLNISVVNLPRWEGQAGGNWDIGLTTNWINIGTGLPTFYNDGNVVLFDDNATGTTNVNITTTVSPKSLTVINSNLMYNFVGSGKISGNFPLIKQGSSVLSVLNTGGNNYTGPTIISNGVLVVTNLANGGSPSAIGASSASPTNLVINSGATFTYGGAPVSVNRGYQANGGTIDAEGNLTLTGLGQTTGTSLKTGPATLTYAGVGQNILSSANVGGSYQVNNGTVVFDGSAGSQTNQVAGEIWIGGTPAAGGNLVVTNSSLGAGSWLAIARGTGTSGYTSTANIYNSRISCNNVSLSYANGISGNSETGILTLNGNSSLNNTGGTGFNLSESTGSTGTVVVSDNSSIFSTHRVLVAMAAGAIGNITLQNNATMTNGDFVSIGQFGVGSAILRDNATWQALGDFNITDLANSTATLSVSNNANLIISTLYVAKAANCTGTVFQAGGTIRNSGGGEWRIGGNASGAANQLGVWNMSDGSNTVSVNFQVGAFGTGFFNQTGGAFYFTGGFPDIGRFVGGIGFVNISGGSWNCIAGNSRLLLGEQGTGTINVSGTGALNLGGTAGPAAAPDASSGLLIGLTSTGIGTLNITNGSVIVTNDTCIGRDGGSQGTVNLYGGVFATRAIYRQTTTGTPVATGNLNFYGGTLKASPNANANFLGNLSAVTIYNGATIDTDTNVINIGQALLGGGNDGGLTKLGNGTLFLNGVNTYTNTTQVSAGALGGTGTIAGAVTVASAARLSPGAASMGTLTINNALTLSGGSSALFRINNNTGGTNNDQVAGLTGVTYGGTLVVTNSGTGPLVVGSTFKLFNSAAAGTGNFTTVTVLPAGSGTFNPATGVLTITSTGSLAFNRPFISNGNLVLTANGAAGTGYTLLSTTNVALPVAQWTTNTTGTFDVSGSSSNAIPLGSGNQFFLLRQP